MTSVLQEPVISYEQIRRKLTRLAGMAAVMRRMEESTVRRRLSGSILKSWKWRNLSDMGLTNFLKFSGIFVDSTLRRGLSRDLD